MNDTIQVTTLVENTVNRGGLQAEHGLAFHFRYGNRSFLFDTGQSDLILRNARALRLRLNDVEAIVLSHGHYDHTGGVQAVRHQAPEARLFLHPAAVLPKFAASSDGPGRSIGISREGLDVLQHSPQAVVWTKGPTEVMKGVFVTGEIPRRNSFEDTGGRFFLDAAGSEPDPLLDDQALYFDTRDGLVVVLGCGHAGVVNTLDYIGQLTGNRPVCALLGGLHLLAATPERMDFTLEAFRRRDLRKIAAGHCTGLPAIVRLWTEFPERCVACSVGLTLEFPV